jgi:hypothetical protein
MLPGEPGTFSRPSRYAPRAGQERVRAAEPLRAGIKYLRCTTSGAAGNGLGTTIIYLRAAAGIDLGTTIKYLRRTTRAAANNGLGTTIKYFMK